MNEYLNDAKFIAISPDDYDLLQKYKEEKLKSNPAHLGDKDAPLANEPFFLNDYEFRILQYRYHLLRSYGFEENRHCWSRKDVDIVLPKHIIQNILIKEGDDTRFFDAIEATGVKVDFKLK